VSVICISSFRSCFYYFLWRRPVCSREEVLYTARLKHWFHSENNVQVKDAQTWVMLKTNSYKNKVASFAFQNGLLYNYSAEVCVEYQCWFQQYKILIKSLQLLSLHVLTLRSGICCQVHQVPCCLRIYINLHLTDRELLPETEMAVLVCATMHLQPYCGIMRLACHAFFRFLFLKSSPLPMVSAGQAGDSAPGGEWLLP